MLDPFYLQPYIMTLQYQMKIQIQSHIPHFSLRYLSVSSLIEKIFNPLVYFILHVIEPPSHEFQELEFLTRNLLPSQTRRSSAEISIGDPSGSSISPSGKCFLWPGWLLPFLQFTTIFQRAMFFMIPYELLLPWCHDASSYYVHICRDLW